MQVMLFHILRKTPNIFSKVNMQYGCTLFLQHTSFADANISNGESLWRKLDAFSVLKRV